MLDIDKQSSSKQLQEQAAGFLKTGNSLLEELSPDALSRRTLIDPADTIR